MASLTRLIFRLTAQLRWPGPPSRSYPMISHMGFHVGYPTLNITGYCRPWAPPPPRPAGDTRERALTRCACTARLSVHAQDARSACGAREPWDQALTGTAGHGPPERKRPSDG